MNEGVTEIEPVPAVRREEAVDRLGKWVAGIPERRIRQIGRFLGNLVYRVDVPHRRIVRRNLGFAFPDWSRERIRRCSRRVFENIGAAFIEILQLRYLGPDEITRRVRMEGIENMAAGLAGPGGVVLISAHFGNWELAPLFISCAFGRPMVSVARTVRPRFLDRWVTGLRTRFGNQVIDKQGGLPQMMRSLRSGHPLGVLIDQGTKRSEGVKIEFFNRTASATPAAALLAMRCRCPVHPAFMLRQEEGGFVFKVLPALQMQRTGDLRADLEKNTANMLKIIEKMIMDHPEQWFWVNKRWKHYFPDLYPEYQARRRRRRMRRFKRLAGIDAANGPTSGKAR